MLLLKRVFAEPFVHFLLLGALIFLLFGTLDDGVGEERENTILVTEARIASLQAGFRQVWLRDPTADETQGMIEDFIREEVLYREALALGLDRDDPAIRKRLRYKIEFLADSGAEPTDPGDEVLLAYLKTNAERYRVMPQIAFRQIYLGENPRQVDIERAREAAAEIGLDGGFERLGLSRLLPARVGPAGPGEIDGAFGAGFYTVLSGQPVQKWVGPVTSGFGEHLVLVTAREPGRMPNLAEIRGAVLRDWRAVRAKEAQEVFFQQLRSRYRIEIANAARQ